MGRVMRFHAALVALRRMIGPAGRRACAEPEPIAWPARAFCYRLLPIQFQVGDRLLDATGEWEIASCPSSTAAGVGVNARVRRLDRAAAVEERTWVAHERISVRRAVPVS
jgi:hypothetical protein